MNINYHFEVLPTEQKLLLKLLSKQNWLSSFYLVGGTALALQIGHRQSIDFDFFIKNDFNNNEIINYLCNLGRFELFNENNNTINGSLTWTSQNQKGPTQRR
ncbi:MAG: hypothetical protein DRJ01_19370 [Bacteroidetes bacterium]|nr:MAG: hypothetical protein DRJ01_19370 [Bacteroidota bacterium]